MAAKVVTPTVKVIESAAELGKAIDSIARAGKKLDASIHQAAVSVLAHAVKHGDITLANRLIESLPKSGRRNALIAWLTSFGPFAADDSGKAVVYKKLAEGDFKLDAAIREPFWQFAPEPAFVPFDFEAVIERAVVAARKALADSKHPGAHKVTVEQIAALEKLVSPAE